MDKHSAVIATLGRNKARPERLALILPNGKVSGWFARDATREEVAASLAKAGYALCSDNTVVRA